MQSDELDILVHYYALLARESQTEPAKTSSLSEEEAKVQGALNEEVVSEEHRRPDETWTSKWVKYSSIDNCANAKELQSVRAAVAGRFGAHCQWIASEKVHGANFCFETDGQCIEYASRTSRLGSGADFYNARETMPKYHPCILRAFVLARQKDPMLVSLLIYGEYFGGYYPGHPAEPGMKKVQKGVAYSPGHHFYAFDVCCVTADGKEYMDFDDARALLLNAGFPLVAAPLFRGTLDELLAIDVESLETTLPSLLGHPPSDGFRIAEGIVLRPEMEVSFGVHRVILKKKAIAFWEATNQFGMAAKTESAQKGADGLEGVLDIARTLANENRLRAVISKEPSLLGDGQAPRLAGLFAKDILDDLEKQCHDELAALGKQLGVLKRCIQSVARGFVQEHVEGIRRDVG